MTRVSPLEMRGLRTAQLRSGHSLSLLITLSSTFAVVFSPLHASSAFAGIFSPLRTSSVFAVASLADPCHTSILRSCFLLLMGALFPLNLNGLQTFVLQDNKKLDPVLFIDQ